LILFTSTTLVQGHDVFDMNTAVFSNSDDDDDGILSSSSELENTLTEHNNPIRIGDCEYPSMEAFHSSGHKSKEDVEEARWLTKLNEARHKVAGEHPAIIPFHIL